jgi:hypothetical protein
MRESSWLTVYAIVIDPTLIKANVSDELPNVHASHIDCIKGPQHQRLYKQIHTTTALVFFNSRINYRTRGS